MKIVNSTAVIGEDLACKYLIGKGYKIIERNFRKKYQEIDIIAVYGSTLVFIEVKTRRSDSYGSPFEGIASWKVRNLVKLAQLYKLMHPNLPDDMRIDAVGVTFRNDKPEIEHLENISGF